jgi:hypothetical protein
VPLPHLRGGRATSEAHMPAQAVKNSLTVEAIRERARPRPRLSKRRGSPDREKANSALHSCSLASPRTKHPPIQARASLARIGPPRRESALDETRQTGVEKDRKTRPENRSNQTLKTRCGTGKTNPRHSPKHAIVRRILVDKPSRQSPRNRSAASPVWISA